MTFPGYPNPVLDGHPRKDPQNTMQSLMNFLGPWTVLVFLVALLAVATIIKRLQRR